MSALTISSPAGARPRLRLVDVPAPRPQGQLRLTRRGRVVVLIGVLLLAGVAFAFGRGSAVASPTGAAPTTTVRTGDTLWSIAQRAEPAADTRDVVARLVAANHLSDGATLRAGQVLQLTH